MQLRKFGHACVRLEDGDRALAIDPGTYSEAAALDGATAVLVTHEHEDHADLDLLQAALRDNPALTIHGPTTWAQAAAARLGDVVVGVDVGDAFTAGGFGVQAVGGMHAEIIDGLPDCPNLGYVVDGIYHPGDSLFVPDEEIHAVLVPVSGPWIKHREAIEFLRAIRPARAFPIHDAMLSERGLANVDAWLEGQGGAAYERIPLGGSVSVAG
jgi:L-ascorbate metabolism protein UlaG (beta-lactamase superfamily)